jgi:hypothetical protein
MQQRSESGQTVRYQIESAEQAQLPRSSCFRLSNHRVSLRHYRRVPHEETGSQSTDGSYSAPSRTECRSSDLLHMIFVAGEKGRHTVLQNPVYAIANHLKNYQTQPRPVPRCSSRKVQ